MDYEIGRTKEGLRMGYTTGSCAAAAAKAAAWMLLTGQETSQVSLDTPKGIRLYLDVEKILRTEDTVECGVQKNSGDDPDVTDGIYIHARVRKMESEGIHIDGGEGVGRVTRKGLEHKIGDAAINQVPRRMIRQEVREVCERAGYTGGLQVEIFIPGGEELAARTFNLRLGIQGGLSILGTSGIVEPMSEKALTDTIYLEMKMLRENGCKVCCITPGNYGTDFLKETLGYDGSCSVKCSNYIGEALDDAVRLGMEGILLIGHVGKLVKLAAGVMNTHSRQADCRMEVFAAHAAAAGAGRELAQRILACITTEEAVELLKAEGLLKTVMETVMERIAFHVACRCQGQVKAEVIVFSKEQGILGETREAGDMLQMIKGGEDER